MTTRGKVSAYTIIIIMAIGTIALVSFQSLKEQKNLTIFLIAKNKKIDDLNNRFGELLEATKKTLTQVKEEKESLSHKIKDLENNNMVHHTSCKPDKGKCKNQKKKEVQDLREILQARESEIITKNDKINQLKFDNKNVYKKKVIELAPKNDFLERNLESFIETIDDISDKNFENSNLQNVARSEDASKTGSLVEERNIVNEDDVEDAKNHKVKKKCDQS